MAVIAVGDLDPDATEAAIRARFADLHDPQSPRRLPDAFTRAPHPYPVAITAEPEATRTSVEVVDAPVACSYRTVADFQDSLAGAIYAHAFEHLGDRRGKLGAVMASATAWESRVTSGVLALGRSVDAEDGPFPTIDAIERLMAATLTIERNGFSPDEIADARAAVVADARRAITGRGVIDGREEAAHLAEHFLDGAMMPGPDDEASLLAAVVPRITPDQVRTAGGTARRKRILLIAGRDARQLPNAMTAKAFMRDAQATPPVFLPRPPAPSSLIDPKTLPPPGRIVDEHTIVPVGVTAWTLSNGAHVLVKPLAADGGRVEVAVSGGRGWRGVAGLDRVTAWYAPSLVKAGVVASGPEAAHPSELFARDQVSIEPSMYEDHASIRGHAPSQHLESLVEAVRLYVAPVHPSDMTFRVWRTVERSRIGDYAAVDPEYRQLLQDLATYELPDSPWGSTKAHDYFDRVDPDRADAIYRDQLGDPAGLTIVFAGDLDPAALRPLVERYLANLTPAGPHLSRSFDPPIRRSLGATTIVRTGGSQPRSRVVYRAWASDAPSKEVASDLLLLERLLDRRLEQRLREVLAGTYSIDVAFSVDAAGVRLLNVSFLCAPENAARLGQEVATTIDEVRLHGVTADEVAILKAQSLRRHQEHLRQASWWTTRLGAAARAGADPGRWLDTTYFFGRITVDSITRAAATDLVFDGSALGILNPATAAK